MKAYGYAYSFLLNQIDRWIDGGTDGWIGWFGIRPALKVQTWKGTNFSTFKPANDEMMTYCHQYLSACSAYSLIECKLRKWSHQITHGSRIWVWNGAFSTLNPNHKGPSKAKEDKSNYFHCPSQQVYTRYGGRLGPSTRLCLC